MNRKTVISILLVIVLVLMTLTLLYGHNLYQMFLRAHGMG